uniref:Small ribosomal subunit protein uS8c n=1 Tax=Epipogium aphyllum TaxID=449980 RepID=A0A0B4N5C2_9ASPA|nr:ribosomal protein S8 [Epipogium aphyllum]AII40877.1 ribosomal protein S8 [Epipogium aphyllum]
MSNDIIADLITSIRNANINKRIIKIKIISNSITRNIVKILLREGFLNKIRKHNERKKYFIILTLKNNKFNLKRISRPSIRIYSNYKQIYKILGGIGLSIISTSEGLMTNKEVILKRIGGEILFYIF